MIAKLGAAWLTKLRRSRASTSKRQGMRSKIKIVSFADGPFAPRKRTFIEQVQAMDMFDEVVVHNLSTLPTAFVAEHRTFIRCNPRGFGYFIWKPLIVLDALRSASRDDVIVYADVGFTLNPGGRTRMLEYFEITRASAHGMLSFSNTHIEYMWTKRDLAVRLGVDGNPLVMATNQLAGGLFVLLPSESNIDLMTHWLSVALENKYHYSDDSPSQLADSRFVEHRHDASIGSLLRKIRGTEIIHYEVQPYDHLFNEWRPMLPMWATRLRE